SLSINDVTKDEGNTGTSSFVFTVTLSNLSSQAITVNYATADGTAKVADNDYQSKSDTLTIPAGSTTGTITVLVNGDKKNELDENFTVTLSNPANATIGTGTGTGTISNDDSEPTISINSVTQPEGNSGTTNFVFTIKLSNPTFQ